MKWIVFCLALLAVYPLALLLRRRPALLGPAAFALGALPLGGLEMFDINVLSDETYRGDARGFEVTVVDLLAAAICLAIPSGRERAPYAPARWAYLAIAAASVLVASSPELTAFGVWKIVRMFVVLRAAASLCEAPARATALLDGLGLGLVCQALLCLLERYGMGVFQAQGSLPHPNSLGMAANLLGPIAFAACFARGARPTAVAAAASWWVCVLLSLSRASMVIAAVEAVAVAALMLLRSDDPRRRVVAGVSLASIGLGTLPAVDSIAERFAEAPTQSLEARERFVEAARAMLGDHPLGVGLNQFSRVLIDGGYADRVALTLVDRDGLVHNVYWLTAAELGYLGALAFAWLLAWPLWVAVQGARGASRSSEVMLGCAVGLGATLVHSTAEWVARQTPIAYVFFMIAGVVFASCSPRRRLHSALVSA